MSPWRTYERLCDQHDTFDDVVNRSLIARFGLIALCQPRSRFFGFGTPGKVPNTKTCANQAKTHRPENRRRLARRGLQHLLSGAGVDGCEAMSAPLVALSKNKRTRIEWEGPSGQRVLVTAPEEYGVDTHKLNVVEAQAACEA